MGQGLRPLGFGVVGFRSGVFRRVARDKGARVFRIWSHE